MTEQPAQKLLVIGFDDPLKASEFMLAAARMQKNDQIRLHDAVFIERHGDGKSVVRETQDLTPGKGAMGLGMWGLLIGTLLGGPIGGLIGGGASAAGGALIGKLVDTGIKDEKIAELREAVPAGSTALALLISHLSVADLQRELERFPGATLVESDLYDAAIHAVRISLGEEPG
ncbi:DUF1269 domain-containing protein [Actinocorallia longicatena]|uniref:DUF1269 domain-containing protein n=1 Tax=Actinocorallia longicatena TaxID=111803 RepID=A0ABP6QJF7_9ACTN